VSERNIQQPDYSIRKGDWQAPRPGKGERRILHLSECR